MLALVLGLFSEGSSEVFGACCCCGVEQSVRMRQVARGEALCQLAESEGDEPLEDAEEDEVRQHCLFWQPLSGKPAFSNLHQHPDGQQDLGVGLCHWK